MEITRKYFQPGRSITFLLVLILMTSSFLGCKRKYELIIVGDNEDQSLLSNLCEDYAEVCITSSGGQSRYNWVCECLESYECPSYPGNGGSPCFLGDGSVGRINNACECVEATDEGGCEKSIYQYDFTPVITLPNQVMIPTVHHISRDEQGNNASTDVANIELMMSHVNTNFQEWNIQFYTKEIRFLDHTGWNIQFSKQDDFGEVRMLEQYEDPKALNIFYFNALTSNGNLIGATALFPHQGNNIKLGSSAFVSTNTGTISHEIGHYLSLMHTDDDNADCNGFLELVDGSNCEDAGDFVCDTPADPNLGSDNFNQTCEYTGNETDANGHPYTPDVGNFMTTFRGFGCESDQSELCVICRNHFTPGQAFRMRSTLASLRSYLVEE